MRLAAFIAENTEEILMEWEAFARTLAPAGQKMGVVALRDFAKDMLDAIVVDLLQPQSNEAQFRKSRGELPRQTSQSAAAAHGAGRAQRGFTVEQIVAEFRALRASVIRLWLRHQPTLDGEQVDELTRFNEAIDEAVADSVARYREDLDHSKDIFLGILGHDLRNPLGAIMVSAGRLLSTDGQEKTGARVLSSAARMKRIIDDLLDFTRSRLGNGIPVTPTEINLADAAKDAVDEIAAANPRRDVHFESSGDVRGCWDGPRVAQAVSNLVGNAVQHGTPDTPIDVSVRGDGDDVVISVHNQGPPIPEHALEHLFTPMSRGEEIETSTSGLGLGLYIASEIVNGHKGHIAVASSAEEGTTFTVFLPRVAHAVGEAQRPSTSLESGDAEARL
jgi:signal transduction histidine kinase